MNDKEKYAKGSSMDEVSPLLVELNPPSLPPTSWGIILSGLLCVSGVGQLVILPLFLDKFKTLSTSTTHFGLVLTSLFTLLFFILAGGSMWIFKRKVWNFLSFEKYWPYFVGIGVSSGIARVILFYVSHPDRTAPVLQSLFSGVSPLFGLLFIKLFSRRPELQWAQAIPLIGIVFILAGCGLGIYEGFSQIKAGEDILKRSLWEILYLVGFFFIALSQTLIWFLWEKYQRNENGVNFIKDFWIMLNLLIIVQILEILTYIAFFWLDILPTFGTAGNALLFINNFASSGQYFFSGGDVELMVYGFGYILSVIVFSIAYVGLQHPKSLFYRSIAEISILPITCILWLTINEFSGYPRPELWQSILGQVLVLIGGSLVFYWRWDTYQKLFTHDDSMFLMDEATISSNHVRPVVTSSLISQYTFSWITPLVYLGYKRPLELHDIWKPPPNETAELNAALFEAEWEKELKKPNPSIGWAYFRAFGYLLILPTTLFSVHLVCVIAGPGILMRDFLVFLETKDSDPTVGWILAFAVFITQLIAATTIQNSFQTSVEMGIRVKQATMYTIYKKIMTLPSVTSTGEIINLTTNDSNRFFLFCRNSQLGWSAVVQMLVVGALLIVELSWSGLIGLLTLLLLLPLQVYISRKIATVRRSTVKVTDERVRTMSDVLSAVQLIKFFAWEDSFAKKVKSIRENELTWLKRGKLLKSVNDSTSLVGVAVTTYITLVSYSLMGNELAASKVFTAITLLNMMRVSLVRVPLFAKTFAELFITFERVKSLLIRNNMIDERILRPKPDNSPAVVSVRKSSFIVGEPRSDKKSNGEKNENPLVRDHFTLEDINFRFESGTLIAIVGSVGSGKSSLLNAIMGQMKKTSGQIEIEGTLALASQEPWLINASLKENILFGESFHHKKYNLVLSNCELLEDLKQLPAGDMTEIGERGINLSGGQKQRVSLARAIYANRDIYLLDDPLSAVDRHVGNNLFHKCIRGLLREKLVFFVTNQLQYLDRCDKIMYLQDGKISGYGTFSELVNTHRAFRELVKKFTNLDENPDRDENKPQVDTKKNVDTKGRRETGSLTSQEARVMGTVDNKIYFEYFKSGGFFLCGLVLLLSISTGVSQVICNWFVSYWIDKQHENSVVFYYSLYAGLTLFYVFSAYMRGYLFAYTLLKSSTKIHNKVFKVIMHAPMTYFYSTPTGRILNRFSSDQDKIDEELPDLMYPAIHFTINSLCTLGIIMSVLYWFVLPALFMFLIFVWIIRYFMATSRELRRLEAITVSPIVAHLSATLKGLPVIRAYGVQTKFQEDYKKHLDLHHSLLQTVEIVARWIGIRLDTIGTIIVAVTAFLIMASRDLISPAIAGLALSYSFQMTGAFQFAVRSFAETDSKMTSAERLLNCLTETPQEAPHVIEHAKPPPSWPQNGAIAFQNVFMKYPVSEAPVLKDLSFKINPKEKIGIVGRTGAGKSSITLALFRMIEIYQGNIQIDGVDISHIGLKDLRSRLAIIPQDPVLFIGTIRTNLDPWESFEDEDIYSALRKVRMEEVIRDLPSGLETLISEGGSNFSLGQRQLLCIARSLLQNSKILVMDEATASIDVETDNIIQNTIRESFKDHTVITIAHRINTIIDSDRIIVMEKGELVEFDSPFNLLNDEDSLFLKLVNESDDAEKLKSFAEYYNKKT